MALLASLCTALAIFVGLYSLVRPRASALPSRLNRYDRNTPYDRNETLALPLAERVGMPLARRAWAVVRRVLPTTMVSGLEQRLVVAGDPVSLYGFLTMQALVAGVGATLALGAVTSGESGIALVAMIAAAALIAASPLVWLRARVQTRKKALLKALPDAVDLIVTTVEAGLGIDAAIAEVGQETQGPLGDELRLTVRETALGRSRREAFQRLIDRTQVPDLKTFVQSLIQAEQTGIPIGQVLRTQAAQVRLRQRQHAEIAAQRAPVKMVLVLVTLVLPAMLLMVMGPAIMRMSEQL